MQNLNVVELVIANRKRAVVKEGSSKRLHIAVVGLLPRQMREVDRRAKSGGVKLSFLPTGLKPAFPSSVDLVVLNIKFISHKWQTAAVQQVGRSKVVRNFGGLKVLVTILNDLAK